MTIITDIENICGVLQIYTKKYYLFLDNIWISSRENVIDANYFKIEECFFNNKGGGEKKLKIDNNTMQRQETK